VDQSFRICSRWGLGYKDREQKLTEVVHEGAWLAVLGRGWVKTKALGHGNASSEEIPKLT
jgi:hypothetical protein